MGLTVDRLLADRRLGLTLAAGAAGTDRTIEWAHVIELVDPTPWMTGGELVMTTGLWLPKDAEHQREYLRRLNGIGAAALAFGTGTVHTTVPDAIQQEADALGFAVLTVAAELPFVAVGRAVADALIADDIVAAKKVADQQYRLARATLTGGIPAVATALAHALGAEVVVLDNHDTVLASAGRRVSDEQVQELIARSTSRRRGSKSALVDDDGYVITQSLGVSGVDRGRLVVATAEAMQATHRLLVSHAVTLISIELEKPTAVLTVERRLRARLLHALLAGILEGSLSQLRYFGFPPEESVVALVVLDIGPTLVAEDVANTRLTELGTRYLSMAADDMLVILLPADGDEDLPDRIYSTLREDLRRVINAGVGAPTPLGDAVKSHRQALAAARNAPLDGRRLVRFNELSTYNLLLGGQSRETLSAVASSALGPLEEYDAERNGDLVRTLDTYLTHNGQWEAAAAALGVHRHTMRNRMGKVAELLGKDIDSAHVRGELWLAVKAHELLRLDA